MDLLTYDELRLLERKERSDKKLGDLGPDFLDRYQAYISDKLRVMDKSDDNIIAAKVKERTKIELANARNSFKNLCEYRVKKVFEQALVDLRMGVKPDNVGLTDSEMKLYDSIRNSLAIHFDSIVKAKLKKGASNQPIIKDDNDLVRFVKDLPEFVYQDMTLGPFVAEDVANLPRDVVKLLLSKGVVKEVLS